MKVPQLILIWLGFDIKNPKAMNWYKYHFKRLTRPIINRVKCFFGRHTFTETFVSEEDGVAVYECVSCPCVRVDHDHDSDHGEAW